MLLLFDLSVREYDTELIEILSRNTQFMKSAGFVKYFVQLMKKSRFKVKIEEYRGFKETNLSPNSQLSIAVQTLIEMGPENGKNLRHASSECARKKHIDAVFYPWSCHLEIWVHAAEKYELLWATNCVKEFLKNGEFSESELQTLFDLCVQIDQNEFLDIMLDKKSLNQDVLYNWVKKCIKTRNFFFLFFQVFF